VCWGGGRVGAWWPGLSSHILTVGCKCGMIALRRRCNCTTQMVPGACLHDLTQNEGSLKLLTSVARQCCLDLSLLLTAEQGC
jgi:hypothetical protein